MKILVADDDPVCRLLLQSFLKPYAGDVLVCSDGMQAWEHMQSLREPLLSVLDWQMPGLDGLQLCQRLRDLPSDRQVYAILLTAQSGRESIVRGLEAGAHDYVVKPFDPAQFQARLRVGMRVLRLQQALADRVAQLEEALVRVKQLHGLLPICCYCKSIRDDRDYWLQVEHYIAAHAEVQFSHSICPSCYARVIEPQLEAVRRAT